MSTQAQTQAQRQFEAQQHQQRDGAERLPVGNLSPAEPTLEEAVDDYSPSEYDAAIPEDPDDGSDAPRATADDGPQERDAVPPDTEAAPPETEAIVEQVDVPAEPKQPQLDVDEPRTEHMEEPVAPPLDEPLEPERGSDADSTYGPVEKAANAALDAFTAPDFEAPDFSEAAGATTAQAKPPASEPQGGYARVVEVVDHGIRYTVDLTTGEKKAVREGESGLGDDATLRVVKWSKEPVKARNQNIGNGSIVVGRGGVRYVPGVRHEPGGARDTGAPRSRPERM